MKPPKNIRKSPLLDDHVRRGRVYQPTLAATGLLQFEDWVRDDLPDLLWPVLALAEMGTSSALLFVRWAGAVQKDIDSSVEPRFLARCLDGRFTGLDQLVARIPEARVVVSDRAAEYGLLPEPVVSVLACYPSRPAPWLIDRAPASLGQEEIDLLAPALLQTITDGHREAVIKCLSIWSAVQAGTFSASSEIVQLLQHYPNDLHTRTQADCVVRAAWLSSKGAMLDGDPDHFAQAIKWAEAFWNTNSMTTRCLRGGQQEERRPRVSAVAKAGGTELADEPPPEADPQGDSARLRRVAMDLVSSYVEALETSPAKLYDPAAQEVHSGLVVRAGRDVITALGAPDLWCMEHGAHVVRMLVEVRIYLGWMAKQDVGIYRQFQEYGAGKAKLYAGIMHEATAFVDDPGLRDAINELENLSHNGPVLDHRTVDTRDSFAEGKSVRLMAQEAGLIELYRQAYYMASGVLHSEWWSVETHAMEPCRNVLHRGHLIPSLALNSGENVALARSWVDQLYSLIHVSLGILGTDESAVKRAFAWLQQEPGAAPQEADVEEPLPPTGHS